MRAIWRLTDMGIACETSPGSNVAGQTGWDAGLSGQNGRTSLFTWNKHYGHLGGAVSGKRNGFLSSDTTRACCDMALASRNTERFWNDIERHL